MRVTGGVIGRRAIAVPKGDVRPTQDKVRAALFNSLGEGIVGVRVLDLFAGSGALGLEAWSRGAALVCWVESDRRVFQTLQENVKTLCSSEGGVTECRLGDAVKFIDKGWSGEPFNLIVADPPYDRDGTARWLEVLLPLIDARGTLAPGGLVVYEQGAGERVLDVPGWVVVRERQYGGTRLVMYKRRADAPSVS